MFRFDSRRAVLAWVGVCAAVSILGCSSEPKGPSRSAKAVESFRETRQNIDAASNQVAMTNQSLQALAAGGQEGDLRAAYTAYVNNVQQMDKMAQRARERASQMRARTDDYVTKWEAELKQIDDDELRKSSRDRMDAARASFRKVADAAQAVREAYEPYMGGLKDVQTFLANDLTAGGVSSVQGKAKSTIAQGETLRQKLAAVSAELDRIAATWASKVQ